MSEWISVADRLPDHDNEVIVCLRDGAVTTMFTEFGQWYLSNTNICTPIPVALWMPLPNPPEPATEPPPALSDAERDADARKIMGLVRGLRVGVDDVENDRGTVAFCTKFRVHEDEDVGDAASRCRLDLQDELGAVGLRIVDFEEDNDSVCGVIGWQEPPPVAPV